MGAPRPSRRTRWPERLLLAAGFVGLGYFSAALAAGDIVHAVGVHELARTGRPGVERRHNRPFMGVAAHGLIGRIEIPRIGLDAVILDGDGSAPLMVGVGHITGSAYPGQPGNVVLAGHRDTFFRALKDAAPGDEITITTPADVYHYTIESTEIVSPDRVDVMARTTQPRLTLITCYPFYYVGAAPRRFVVSARPF